MCLHFTFQIPVAYLMGQFLPIENIRQTIVHRHNPCWLTHRGNKQYDTIYMYYHPIPTFISFTYVLWLMQRLNFISRLSSGARILYIVNSCWNFSVFSCDQAALQMVFSVRLSVCPSVCHTFLTMFPSSYHHEIFRSYYQWLK